MAHTPTPDPTPGPTPGPVRTSRAGRRRAPAAVSPDRLAERLASATGPACSHRVNVPLSAAALAVLSLGAGPDLRAALSRLAETEPGFAVDVSRRTWQMLVEARPFLAGHLGALIGWLEDPTPEDLAGYQRCLQVLASVDLLETVRSPEVAGELLGPLYTFLRSPGGRKAVGAFFTPMSIAGLMAALTPLQEGDSFTEPCSGAGALAVAAAQDMRRRGLDPATVSWSLVDLDPVAVALCGINAVLHGFGQRVDLRCANALTLGEMTRGN